MIQIETIETAGLGDRSYLATDGVAAVAVDPQRDIDRILRLIDDHGVRLSHVLETHIHNDYLTGGLELAARTGAEYAVSADDDVSFSRRGVRDGDVLTAGDMRLRALHTPGHTFHHLSYVLQDATGVPQAVFTGGSMLYGTTGRTDLLGPEHTRTLARQQFASARRLAAELPPRTRVFPTHGFGSFCTVTPASREDSTIGQEGESNPALTLGEQEYVDSLVSGLRAYPAYYSRMSPINRRGPEPVDLSLPERLDPAELRRRIDAGEWVVDLRERTAFAAGHLAGSLGFELSANFVTYLGWLYRWGAPLTLIGQSREQVAEATRELVRIGLDTLGSLAGMAAGDITALASGQELRSYRVSDFAGLAAATATATGATTATEGTGATGTAGRDFHVLDARRHDERAEGGVRDSQHIPLHELDDRIDEVPDGEVWVYCSSGYRASIAASVLDRPGRDVVLVNDAYDSAARAGLTVTMPRV